MQDLRRSDTLDTVGGHSGELNGLMSESPHEPERYRHPRDIFTSGEAVIMETSVSQIVRDQWQHTSSSSFRVPTVSTPSGGPASIIFRRRLGIGTRPDT